VQSSPLASRCGRGCLLLLLAVAGSGCKRGALAEWLGRNGAAAASSATPVQLLQGTDCPDGLARCVGGSVEVSRVKRVPRPCPATFKPEDCVCPWEEIEACTLGCAAEGAEVVVDPARAVAQLCAPDPAHPVARPAPGAVAPRGVCDAAGYRCVASLVVVCADSASGDGGLDAHVVGACIHGCFQEGELLGEEEAELGAATRILCAR
jgi:hypothetical protein